MDVASRFRMIPRQWLQFSLRQLLLATFLVGLVCWWFFQRPHGLQDTGNVLDVAIFGRGYFICTDPESNATLYTRCGHLSINANGQLCVRDGRLVEPIICVPPEASSVSIASDGNVYFYEQGDATAQSLGQLNIATFVNAAGLREVLHGFYEETDSSGQPQYSTPGTLGAGLMQQGYLESPDGQQVEATTLLLVGLCSLVGWLAWEVRCLRLSLRSSRLTPCGANAE